MFCFAFVTPFLINVFLFLLDGAQERIIHTYTIRCTYNQNDL